MHLRDALDQLTAIRSQLAATARLRGLGAAPMAVSGGLGLAAAAAQAQWLADPLARPQAYLLLWTTAAALAALPPALAVLRHLRQCDSALGRDTARLAAAQFAPSLLAGAAVTAAIALQAPLQLWLLPGLWQLLFGLGNLAARALLPAPAVWVGGLFLCSGSYCLSLGEAALSPWAMGLPFGTGQLALAAILWWHHERGGCHG